MMKEDKNIMVWLTISIFLFIGFVGYLILKEIEDFRIDHKCYMMSDEEFFQTEMCKPYWSYRQVGKK